MASIFVSFELKILDLQPFMHVCIELDKSAETACFFNRCHLSRCCLHRHFDVVISTNFLNSHPVGTTSSARC